MELTQARNELESTLEDLTTDLQDLIDSVRAVEGDPFRYGLDIDEVGRRRKLVEDVGIEVEDMRRQLPKTVHSTQSNSQASPPPKAFDPDSPIAEDNYGAFEQQRQVEMMQEQDEALDDVFQTVGNLRQQADDMGRELGEQGEMLEDVGNVATRVEGKLQTGMKKISYVIKKNEGIRLTPVSGTCTYSGSYTDLQTDSMSSCCIGILILVLIILLILVISN